MIKAVFDFLVAALLLVLLAPLMGLIALAIKWDSPGPILFRQGRVGRGGRVFAIYKFRSMRHALDISAKLTTAHDARITRVGAFLRASKLDELPQLFNILQGQMSLVGPRPEVPEYVALYPGNVREKVLSVRPGVTDYASIAFRDESQLLSSSSDPRRTYIDEIMPIKLRYYTEYVESRSFWMDLRIIGLTALAVFRRGNQHH